MFLSRIALRATAGGGDRFAIVMDKNIPSRKIASRQIMRGYRHARRASQMWPHPDRIAFTEKSMVGVESARVVKSRAVAASLRLASSQFKLATTASRLTCPF